MKTMLVRVTAVLAVAGLAACGGDDAEEPALGGETTSTTTEVEPFESTEGATGEASQECTDALESVGTFDLEDGDLAELYPAAKACSSLDDWVAAATATGVLEEGSAEPVARDVCRAGRADDPELVDAPMCRQVTT